MEQQLLTEYSDEKLKYQDGELPGHADGLLQRSIVGSGVGGRPFRLPPLLKKDAVGKAGLAILQRRRDVVGMSYGVVIQCTFAQTVCSLISLYDHMARDPDDGR